MAVVVEVMVMAAAVIVEEVVVASVVVDLVAGLGVDLEAAVVEHL